MASDPPKVLISYSHDSPEHKDRVLVLSNRLRGEGIDCTIDQYLLVPPEGGKALHLSSQTPPTKRQSEAFCSVSANFVLLES
jgi:SEFIR domain